MISLTESNFAEIDSLNRDTSYNPTPYKQGWRYHASTTTTHIWILLKRVSVLRWSMNMSYILSRIRRALGVKRKSGKRKFKRKSGKRKSAMKSCKLLSSLLPQMWYARFTVQVTGAPLVRAYVAGQHLWLPGYSLGSFLDDASYPNWFQRPVQIPRCFVALSIKPALIDRWVCRRTQRSILLAGRYTCWFVALVPFSSLLFCDRLGILMSWEDCTRGLIDSENSLHNEGGLRVLE